MISIINNNVHYYEECQSDNEDAEKNVLGAERDFLKELLTTVTTTTAGTTTIAPWV